MRNGFGRLTILHQTLLLYTDASRLQCNLLRITAINEYPPLLHIIKAARLSLSKGSFQLKVVHGRDFRYCNISPCSSGPGSSCTAPLLSRHDGIPAGIQASILHLQNGQEAYNVTLDMPCSVLHTTHCNCLKGSTTAHSKKTC
jgi:hypothetical protein